MRRILIWHLLAAILCVVTAMREFEMYILYLDVPSLAGFSFGPAFVVLVWAQLLSSKAP